MTTATETTEIRPAANRTYLTHSECAAAAHTQLWIRWAEHHGFAWEILGRHYYNMRHIGAPPESHDEDYHGPGRYYWELHIKADASVTVPDYVYLMDDVPSASERTAASLAAQERYRQSQRQAAIDRLSANLADLREILPAWMPMGTLMGDALYSAGGRARELHEAMRDGLISESDLRSRIASVR